MGLSSPAVVQSDQDVTQTRGPCHEKTRTMFPNKSVTKSSIFPPRSGTFVQESALAAFFFGDWLLAKRAGMTRTGRIPVPIEPASTWRAAGNRTTTRLDTARNQLSSACMASLRPEKRGYSTRWHQLPDTPGDPAGGEWSRLPALDPPVPLWMHGKQRGVPCHRLTMGREVAAGPS